MFEQQDDDNLSKLFRKSAKVLEEKEELSPSDSVWERLSKRLDEDLKTPNAIFPLSKKSSISEPSNIKQLSYTSTNKKLWFSIAAICSGLAIGLLYLYPSNSDTPKTIAEKTKAPIASNHENTLPIAKNSTSSIQNQEGFSTISTEDYSIGNSGGSLTISPSKSTAINPKQSTKNSTKKQSLLPKIPGFKIESSDGYVSKIYEKNVDSEYYSVPITMAAPNTIISEDSKSSTMVNDSAILVQKIEAEKQNSQTKELVNSNTMLSKDKLYNNANTNTSNTFKILKEQDNYKVLDSDKEMLIALNLSENISLELIDSNNIIIRDSNQNKESSYTLSSINKKGNKAIFKNEEGKKLILTNKNKVLSIKYK